MKKTNRFWVIVPAVVMLFSNAVSANVFSTNENVLVSEIVALPPSQLNLAISKGDFARVKELVEIGVDINKKDERGVSPLMYAIVFDQPQIVSYLIGNGADYRATDASGVAVYEYAEKSKSKEIIKLISDARKRR
ncbi:ankyrin repeat domain-containing protein [Flavobacterium cucumis]|uniref:Ankyrin repeat-containing protein n=1 Tax=Flavobacterium cucumis TaxID=416016 RepID=A0A1M7ZY43_9FLAO|nr:ankyrin repeat domain-containing protein [Flavobacterium cucumis]SHO73792.1 Ankyrin repeat-containing protein [Flavobacterium cucumis]